MLISETTGIESAAAANRANEAALGQEDFLRMLIAQLENQDPLNPQDGTEFTAQLAQFSSLEQSIAMRTTLENIASSLNRSDSSAAIDLIGKEVRVESPYFDSDGGPSSLSFSLDGASDTTGLEIRDAAGAPVRSLDLGSLAAGEHTYNWDGLGRSGIPVPPGIYSITLNAAHDGVPIASRVFSRGVVSGADISGSDAALYLGDIVVPLSRVLEVRDLSAEGDAP